MFVISNKNIFLTIGGVIMAAAIVAVAYFGLTLGIDFTGGSILEVQFTERPSIAAVEQDLRELGIEEASIRPSGEQNYIIRTPVLAEEQKADLLEKLRQTTKQLTAGTTSPTTEGAAGTTSPPVAAAGSTSTPDVPAATTTTAGQRVGTTTLATQKRFSTIGPTVGSELATNATYGIIGVVIAIVLFVAFAFRKVSEPVSSWIYGSTAIIALIHDILLPTGVFAVLGHIMGAQVDLLFVMALLAILGYSVNDTIVVFDRIRENLRENYDELSDNFADIVGDSLSQTYARSINTSLTTLIVLAALYFLGGESTRLFALTLLVGVLAGTYSSIFFASPILVQFREWQKG